MEYKGFFFHISTAQSSNWKGWRVQWKQYLILSKAEGQQKKGVTELKGLEKKGRIKNKK
jgi:hypothetical protein